MHAPSCMQTTTTGFEMTVTGNWELYKFSVKTDKSVWVPIWQADLPSITYEEPDVKPNQLSHGDTFRRPVGGSVS